MGCAQSSPFIRPRRYDYVTDLESKQRPISKRRSVPQHEFLSEQEKELLVGTWQRLADDPVGIGIDVFLRIFQLAPDARHAFPSFSCLTDTQLVDNVVFRSHATRFVRAVDFVMSNLNALDIIVVENLVRLGRHHCAAVCEFRVEYLEVFEAAMTDVWAQRLGVDCFDAATRHAWSKIFRLITSHVRDGYNDYKSATMKIVAAANGGKQHSE